MLQRGHSGDGCDLASTLCKYDLRKDDFICSELGKGATSEAGKSLFRAGNGGGGVRSILLLPLVARCLETIDVSIWCMFFLPVVVTVCRVGVCGNACCVAAIVKNSVF